MTQVKITQSLIAVGFMAWTTVSVAAGLPVTVATIQSAPWHQVFRTLARVRSNNQITLTAPVGGRVLGPFQRPGLVHAGVILMRIAPVGLRAQIAAARAQERYTQTKLGRYRRLLVHGFVARELVDNLRLALAEAQGQLRALKSEDAAQTLRAPFSGTLRYLVAPGAIVPTALPIMTLMGRGRTWAEALVSPDISRQIHADVHVYLNTGRWHGVGTIRNIGNRASHYGLVRVYIDLPLVAPLLPGQWVRCRIPVDSGQAFRLPVEAIVMHGDRSFVFIVRKGHALPVSVKLLARHQNEAFVQGTLRDGEKVILTGNTRVSPGSAVEIMH
ncbi:MAG: efflux RND transporter periplasmic adaptor subunit [Gammaproteobacteria bacterium]